MAACPTATPTDIRSPECYDDLNRAILAGGRDVANQRTALRKFMTAHDRAPSDPVGLELRDQFFEGLARYRDSLHAGGFAPGTIGSAVSRLRAVQRFVPSLGVVEVVGGTFSTALDAVCAASGLGERGLARRADVGRSSIRAWRSGKYLPDASQSAAVERLERALSVRSGALAALLPRVIHALPPVGFAKVLRSAIITYGISFREAAARAGITQTTLYSWTSGRTKPGSGQRKRSVPALERALHLAPGTLLASLGPVASQELRYYATLTPQQLAEYARFVAHKTDRTEHRTERQPLEFWRVRADDTEPPSARVFRRMLAAYYGYAALPADAPNPLLRGMGRAPETMSITELADAEAVIAFLKFQADRAKYAAASRQAATAERHAGATPPAPPKCLSGFNNGTRTILASVRSVLRRETGYLWQAHDIRDTVARTSPDLAPDAALARWRDRVEAAARDLAKFQKRLTTASLVAPTRDHGGIQRILAMDEPMFALLRLRERAGLAWEQAARHSHNRVRQASQLRNFLLVALLCVTPLRKSHWESMTFKPDGTGNLRKVSDPARRHHGHYELYFSRESFKALAGFRDDDYVVEIPAELTPLIDLYLREYRPALTGAAECDYVLRPEPTASRRPDVCPTAPVGVDTIIAGVTRRLIPEFAPSGMRSHAFRHIVATHLVRNYPDDGVRRAADALHNTDAMIRRHYGHLSARDRTRTAVNMIAAEFERMASGRTDKARG